MFVWWWNKQKCKYILHSCWIRKKSVHQITKEITPCAAQIIIYLKLPPLIFLNVISSMHILSVEYYTCVKFHKYWFICSGVVCTLTKHRTVKLSKFNYLPWQRFAPLYAHLQVVYCNGWTRWFLCIPPKNFVYGDIMIMCTFTFIPVLFLL